MAIIPRGEGKGRRYGVRVPRDGKPKWIGTRPTLREARQLEREALMWVAEPTAGPVCDVFAGQWLEQKHAKDSTKAQYRRALNGFRDDFQGRRMADVSRADAFDWASENRWRADVVRAVFEHARKLDLIASNPFSGLRLPQSRGRKDLHPLSVADVDRLARVAQEAHGEDYGHVMAAFVLFTAYTGMRPGEVYALEWGDIDVPAREVHVQRRLYEGRVDLPKGNRTRRIALAPQAQFALRDVGTTSGLVFRGKLGRMLSAERMNNTDRAKVKGQPVGAPYGYWTLVEEAFGRPVDIAELRHFCGHHLYVTLNRPARVVAAQLGHRTPRLVEERYGHFEVGALDELKAAFAEPLSQNDDGAAVATPRLSA
jgi:integrase